MTIEEMKDIKREKGYTNEKIAELSGVPLGTVQKIFSGETSSPRYETLQKLESALKSSNYEYIPYDIDFNEPLRVTEPTVLGYEYYTFQKQKEKTSKKIKNYEYAPMSVEKRIGIAAGKFKVPDERYFYDDEIAEMFEEM